MLAHKWVYGLMPRPDMSKKVEALNINGAQDFQIIVNAETTGYQIQYARNKKFTKNVKYRTIAGKKNVKKTIQKLKSKKTYYVRVRTYKQVSYNGKKIKICSEWSKIKKIKVK